MSDVLGWICVKDYLIKTGGKVIGQVTGDGRTRAFSSEYVVRVLENDKIEIKRANNTGDSITFEFNIPVNRELIAFFGLYAGDGAKGSEDPAKLGRVKVNISFSQREPNLVRFMVEQFREFFSNQIRITFSLGEDSAFFMAGPGLEARAQQVTRWCIQNGADSVLILPSDIPLLTVEDVNRLVELGSEWRSVVVAPSNDGGTSALLRTPPDVMPSCFGYNSFVRHLLAAQERSVKATVYRSRSIALDLDTPEDLKSILVEQGGTHTHGLLEELNVYARLGVKGFARARASRFGNLRAEFSKKA